MNTGLPKDVAVSVSRSIYYHRFHKDFQKVLVSIDGNSIVCLQYCFGREERLIVAKEPHSNAKKEKDEMVEIMDLYKREQNSQLYLIRDVNLAPKVSLFVSTEQQLIDIERFYTKTSHFFLLGFDST